MSDQYDDGFYYGQQDLKEKIYTLIDKWEKESKYREDIASEDWVSNTLNDCIDEIRSLLQTNN